MKVWGGAGAWEHRLCRRLLGPCWKGLMILQSLCLLFVMKIVNEWIVAALLVSHAIGEVRESWYMNEKEKTRRTNIEQRINAQAESPSATQERKPRQASAWNWIPNEVIVVKRFWLTRNILRGATKNSERIERMWARIGWKIGAAENRGEKKAEWCSRCERYQYNWSVFRRCKGVVVSGSWVWRDVDTRRLK
jgi:hypothetical protein